MTKRQLEIVQHSLGADEYGSTSGRFGGGRNHFCAGGEDVDRCREIVALGFMREHPSSELTGGDPLFTVTDAGKTAMRAESPSPPKLTRSQKRYRAFLDADCGYSFGEWMRDQSRRMA